jgi:hypothetical protein
VSIQQESAITMSQTSSAMDFPKNRHTPILDPAQKRCPVCNRAVYSLAGIHFQCAIDPAIALESKSKRQVSNADSLGALIDHGKGGAMKASTESL